MKFYCNYRMALNEAKTTLEVLKFIGRMLIEIWWNTRDGYRNRD